MKYLIPFAVLSIVFIFGYLEPLSVSPNKSDSLNQEHLANEIVREMTDCDQQSMWWKCLETLAKKLHRTYPLRDILAAIDTVRDETIIFERCHSLGHFLGREEYKRTGNIPKALEHTSFVCYAASIHGVVEGYLMKQNLSEVTREKLNEFATAICQPIYSANKLTYDECLHGVGHALMLITGNDLPLSLKLCDTSSVDYSGSCYSGVFMENNLGVSPQNVYNVTASGHISNYLFRSDDPLYPCSILEEQYLFVCYQYKVDFSLRATGGDFDKAIEACLQVPGQYQSWCFYKVGKMAPDFMQESSSVKAVCDKIYSLAGDLARSKCAEGAVRVIVSLYDGNTNKVNSFCSLFEKKSEKRECYDIAADYLNELNEMMISQ